MAEDTPGEVNYSSAEAIGRIYSKIADDYAERYFNDLSDAPIVDRLITQLPEGARVLDAGCGPGNFTNYMRTKDINAEGIDMSPEMLAHAQKRVPDATFRQMDMRWLRYPDGVFDGTLAAYSLIHIPTPEMGDALRELHRVLTQEGLLLIIGQAGEPDHVEDDPFAPGEKVFVNFFSEQRLRTWLEANAFEVLETATKESRDPQSWSKGVVSALARAIK